MISVNLREMGKVKIIVYSRNKFRDPRQKIISKAKIICRRAINRAARVMEK